MIAIHAEAIDGQPDAMRWVVPAGTLPMTGTVVDAPGTLGEFLRDGTLAGVSVEGGAVITRLGPTGSWTLKGAAVRTAMHAALERAGEWRLEARANVFTTDDVLLEVARTVLCGRVGDFIRSHGGEADIVSACSGVLTVRLSGSCTGCPAAGFTLHARLEREIRERFPSLRGLVAA